MTDDFYEWLLEERKTADTVSIDLVIYKYGFARSNVERKRFRDLCNWLFFEGLKYAETCDHDIQTMEAAAACGRKVQCYATIKKIQEMVL